MRCEDVKALLNGLIDGELSDKERQAVEKHLSECEVCRQEKLQLERVVALLRSLPKEKVPVDMMTVLRSRRVGLGLIRTVTAIATIAAAVLIAIVITPIIKQPVMNETPSTIPTPSYQVTSKMKNQTSASAQEKKEASPTTLPEPSLPLKKHPKMVKPTSALRLKQQKDGINDNVGRPKGRRGFAPGATRSQGTLPKEKEGAGGIPQVELMRRLAGRYAKEIIEMEAQSLREASYRRCKRKKTIFGGIQFVLYKVSVTEDAVERLLNQINAMAEVDEKIMKVGVKRGRGWVEVELKADKRGARIIRAILSAAPEGKVLFVLRFVKH